MVYENSKKTKKTDNDERLSKLHSEAIERFANCQDYYSELYRNCEEDIEFTHGINQWDDADIQSRRKQRRPYLTINKMKPFTDQVINTIKQARPAIRVTPVDDGGDADTAQVFQGIIRNIERTSKANNAYDAAAMNAVAGGLGWIRISTDYDSPMSFDQKICIDRVINFQDIYVDPNTQTLDGSDIEYAYVFEEVSREKFKSDYPDAVTDSLTAQKNATWFDDETVQVAEYFYKEYEEREIYLVEVDGKDSVVTKAEYDLIVEALGTEPEIIDERTSLFPIIKWCKITGAEILEENEWVGKYIPLVPVYGSEVYIDGRREFHSLIRQAKDSQRMSNYWKTANTEFIALQQKAPYVGALGSFETRKEQWRNANNLNIPFLEYDIIYDDNGNPVTPPQKQPPITGSPTMSQEAAIANQDIKEALGMYNENMGDASNAISGVAVRNRQIYGDNSTFHFIDNLSASISQVGCILVDLIPRLYSRKKVIRIIGEDGQSNNVPVNQPYIKTENGKEPAAGREFDGIYDLKAGTYDVVCDVGASYSSRRQEFADKMIELAKAEPRLMEVGGDLLVESMDMPQAQKLADRIRTQMPPEVLQDDPQAARMQAVAGQMKQLEDQLLNMEAALQDKSAKEDIEAQSKLAEIDIKRQELAIDAQKTKADIDKIYSEINKTNTEAASQSISNVDAIVGDVTDLQQSVEMLIDFMESEVEEQQVISEPEPIAETMLSEETSENE